MAAKKPTTPSTSTASTQGQSKKKIILIVAALALILAGGGTFFMLKKNNSTETVEIILEKSYLEFPGAFTWNMPNSRQFGQLNLTLQVETQNSSEIETIQSHFPRLQADILLLLAEKSLDDWQGQTNKQKIQFEIQNLINEILGAEGMVHPSFNAASEPDEEQTDEEEENEELIPVLPGPVIQVLITDFVYQ